MGLSKISNVSNINPCLVIDFTLTILPNTLNSFTKASEYFSLGLVIYFGKEHLYHWVVYLNQGLDAGQPGFDKILAGKDWFLSSGWLLIGVPTIMIIWWVFRIILVRLSHKEDEQGGLSFFKKSVIYSAAF